MTEPVRIEVGACRCPRTPHPADAVWLAGEVTNALGFAATQALKGATSTADYMGVLGSLYLHLGIVRWTFVTAEGKPEPITPENIERLLPWNDGGADVAEAADELYGEAIFLPLARRLSKALEPGPTATSTSATTPSSSTTPTSPEPSSPLDTAGTPSEVPAP